MLKFLNILKGSDGSSMVEVIIAIAIGAIGTMGSYSLLAGVHGTQAANKEVLEAQEEARNVMERITRELRESSPEAVWPNYEDHGSFEHSYVYFFTPRNAKGQFKMDSEAQAKWQRAICYWLNESTNTLYRYQYYLDYNPDLANWYDFEIISEKVEKLTFSRTREMITVSIRTFTDGTEDSVGSVARSYADFETTVKLRN